MSRKLFSVFLAGSLLAGIAVSPLPALAKKWTVTERIEKLSKEIDEGRQANELTVAQVESLKKTVASIKDKMEKMKAKNGGKLSVPDTKKLHDEMTGLSVKITKTRLDNVYKD
ncbi:MAG TPA: hypothetical protein V6D17_08125 [Candidatus Obscuribacterales bacterium]